LQTISDIAIQTHSMIKQIILPYFPKELKYITPLIFGAGIYFIYAGYFVWAVVMILLGIIVLTTKYVTEINLNEKRFRDYLSFLWLPLDQESKRFNTIDRIVITRERIQQKINTRVQSRQLDWFEYTATIIFDTATSTCLAETTNTNSSLG
jgi:hypothetical protein